MRGKVLWYSASRRYGFILGQDNQEYFFPKDNLATPLDEVRLTHERPVSFEPKQAKPNWEAKDVRVVAGAEPTAEFDVPATLKRNPFTPQDPVTDPRRFGGRRDVLRSAVDSLFNTRNILITGPRGIGKSSLAYQLLYMTQGERQLLTRLALQLGDFQFDYITGDHRCAGDNSLADVAHGLLATLASDAGGQTGTSEVTTKTGVDFKFIQATTERKSTPLSPSDASNWFVAESAKLFAASNRPRGGMAFLIDEVDALGPDVLLGPFLKATVEKFRLDAHRTACFIVSGVTGTSTKLLAQHPSTSRLLERVELQQMADEELDEVIEFALADTGTVIEASAKTRMVQLANSFPQPLHLLGYHAFRLDEDARIDTRDVEAAKDYIVKKALRQDFEEQLQQIGQGLRRDILRVSAGATDLTVTLNYLSKQLPKEPVHSIQSDLGVLVSRGVLERHSEHVYGFREPLFEIYCRWVFDLDGTA